jgi:hypothetical protein
MERKILFDEGNPFAFYGVSDDHLRLSGSFQLPGQFEGGQDFFEVMPVNFMDLPAKTTPFFS